jgi:small-conductance mechanosensitive channel
MSNEDQQIEDTMNAINLMYENIGDEMSVEQLETIRDRHQTLIEQSIFWLDQENPTRYIYDLRDFANWLFKYIQWDKNDE